MSSAACVCGQRDAEREPDATDRMIVPTAADCPVHGLSAASPSPRPYFEDNFVKLYLGDALEILPPRSAAQSQRDPACVGRWPECESGAYDPRCCRFPKSCSCVSSAASTDPMTRIAEIRQENRGGDVSATDIDWLLAVAEAAVWLTKAPFGSIRERHFYRTREALNRD